MSKSIFLLFIVIITGNSFAQDYYEQKKLDRKRWENYRENYEYVSPEQSEGQNTNRSLTLEDSDGEASNGQNQGREEQGTEDTRRKRETQRNRASERQSNETTPGFESNSTVLFYIALGIGIIALGTLLFYLIKNQIGPSNKKAGQIEKAPPETEEEEIMSISSTELQQKIEAFLQKGDYRQAIRLYYTYTLKMLSEKGWIIWHKEKTNIFYLREMQGKEAYQTFSETTRIYELVWYGKAPLNQKQYDVIEPMYRNLILKLNPNAL